MTKKEFIFILGFTMLMGIIWVVGELVMGLWIAVVPWVYIIWRGGIVVVTLAVCLWHSFLEDKSDKKDPKRAKYERKTQKRNK